MRCLGVAGSLEKSRADLIFPYGHRPPYPLWTRQRRAFAPSSIDAPPRERAFPFIQPSTWQSPSPPPGS